MHLWDVVNSSSITFAHHNYYRQLAHVRFLAVGLIFAWLKLLKLARAYPMFGPFVVMLGHTVSVTVRLIGGLNDRLIG
jgi:hypothetical protein